MHIWYKLGALQPRFKASFQMHLFDSKWLNAAAPTAPTKHPDTKSLPKTLLGEIIDQRLVFFVCFPRLSGIPDPWKMCDEW